MMKRCSLLLLMLFFPLLSQAANPCDNILDVERQFDTNGDQIVAADDWRKMTAAQRLEYVRQSILVAGGQPDKKMADGKTSAQHYAFILDHLYREDG